MGKVGLYLFNRKALIGKTKWNESFTKGFIMSNIDVLGEKRVIGISERRE